MVRRTERQSATYVIVDSASLHTRHLLSRHKNFRGQGRFEACSDIVALPVCDAKLTASDISVTDLISRRDCLYYN